VAWVTPDSAARANTLEAEFKASMQAIMACAFAIKAFYGSIAAKIDIPRDALAKWRENRTPRYAQIAEILRRVFSLTDKEFAPLRQALCRIFKLRDRAVHPSGRFSTTLLHPELQVKVEWRYAVFRYQNAAENTEAAVRTLSGFVLEGRPSDVSVRKSSEALSPFIEFALSALNTHHADALCAPRTTTP
jgi:hypothetical protein